jgi:hypothetical protein
MRISHKNGNIVGYSLGLELNVYFIVESEPLIVAIMSADWALNAPTLR